MPSRLRLESSQRYQPPVLPPATDTSVGTLHTIHPAVAFVTAFPALPATPATDVATCGRHLRRHFPHDPSGDARNDLAESLEHNASPASSPRTRCATDVATCDPLRPRCLHRRYGASPMLPPEPRCALHNLTGGSGRTRRHRGAREISSPSTLSVGCGCRLDGQARQAPLDHRRFGDETALTASCQRQLERPFLRQEDSPLSSIQPGTVTVSCCQDPVADRRDVLVGTDDKPPVPDADVTLRPEA